MKKVLVIVFLLFGYLAKAQIYQNPTLFGKIENRLLPYYALGVPADTSIVNAYRGYPHISLRNDTLWKWSPSLSQWLIQDASLGSDNNYTDSIYFTNNVLNLRRAGLGTILQASFDTTLWHTKPYYDSIYGSSATLSTNYYTKTQINSIFAGTTALGGYNKSQWDNVYNSWAVVQALSPAGWATQSALQDTADAIRDAITLSSGDMLKAVYDQDGSDVVDDAEMLNGQLAAYYLSRANHTGTQTASTISDFVDNVRTSISETVTGIDYNNTTGVFSITSGYVIPTTTEQTNWNTAFGWGNHGSAGYLTSFTETDPIVAAINGIIKSNGSTISVAVGGTDYVVPNSAITGATKTKITYDAKGLVTAGTDLAAGDIPDLSATYSITSHTHTFSSLTSKPTTLSGYSISDTKANFDAALSDGNFLYVGDVTQYTDELAQDAIGAMVNSTLTYTDATPLLGINLGNANTWTAAQSGPINAYDATGWNGSAKFATEDAIRDKIESLVLGGTYGDADVENYLETYTGDVTATGTVFSITAGSIVNADINASAAIAYSKLNLTNSIAGTDIALGSDAQGDIMYYNGTDWVRLAAGTDGQFLETNGVGANPQWSTVAGGGDVTKVGTPANNQIAVWTGDGTAEGTNNFIHDNSGFGQVKIMHTAANSGSNNANPLLVLEAPSGSNEVTIDYRVNGVSKGYMGAASSGEVVFNSQSNYMINNLTNQDVFMGSYNGGVGGFPFFMDASNAALGINWTSYGSVPYNLAVNGTSYIASEALFGAQIRMAEIAAPSTPATGYSIIYVATDGTLHIINDAGTDTQLGSGGSSGITVGTTTITSGTNTRILYNNSGVVGEYPISGSGNVAMTTSPDFTTPTIGGVAIPSISSTHTLTNKRITKRTGSTASNTSLTVDSDSYDQYSITALAGAITVNNPTGTPTDGQTLLIRLKDNGTARAITWGANFRAGSDISLPTTTVISKDMYIGFVWNAAASKWDLVTNLNGF